jgi:hypothetical protein
VPVGADSEVKRSVGAKLGLWLITTIPSWLLLSSIVILVAGGATIVGLLVRRSFPILRTDQHNDALKFAYGVIGFVYAFFVGFIVSGLWSQVAIADGVVRAEVAAGVQIARDRFAFNPADQERIRKDLREYERAARAEWPLASRGEFSADADRALKQLYKTVREIQPETDLQKTFLNTTVSNLEAMSKGRTERLSQAKTHQGIRWPLWLIVGLTSCLVVAAAVTYGVESQWQHHTLVLTVSGMVAVILFLVLDLSFPYLGDIATPPAPEHTGLHHPVEPSG